MTPTTRAADVQRKEDSPLRTASACQGIHLAMTQQPGSVRSSKESGAKCRSNVARDQEPTRGERASDLVVELALFMSSYAPLFAILAIRFRSSVLIVACATLSVAGFAAGAAVLARFHRVAAGTWPVRTVEDRGGEVAGYLATYLLPFVTVAEPDIRDVVGYALFLAS